MDHRYVQFSTKRRSMTLGERFAKLSADREGAQACTTSSTRLAPTPVTKCGEIRIIIIISSALASGQGLDVEIKSSRQKTVSSKPVQRRRFRGRRHRSGKKNTHNKSSDKDERDWDCRPSTVGEVTKEQLDRELEEYFSQDSGRVKDQLDRDLEDYFSRGPNRDW